LNQSTVLRRRFAKVSGKPLHGLVRSTEPGGQDLAISSIAVPDWVTRDLLPATGFSELIGDPFGKKHCAIRPHLPAGLGFRQGPVNMTTASIQAWLPLEVTSYLVPDGGHRSGKRMRFQKFDRVSDGPDGFCCLVRNFEAEFPLELDCQFDHIQAIGA
jgi:hypothetical protein